MASNGDEQTTAGLGFDLEAGAVRGIRFGGVEALRMIDCPVRDAAWRTLTVEETSFEASPGRGFRRRFRTRDGALAGTLSIAVEEDGPRARLEARLELVAERDLEVNRAGFVLLHPIAGVKGMPLEVTHSNGSIETLRFPQLISPGQPVFDIVGLRHKIGHVDVEIAFEGEVFEMEDQRNWTDASFKTYCRPLSRPWPYRLAAGDAVRQRIVITLTRGTAGDVLSPTSQGPAVARAPGILLAHEPALGGSPPEALARLGIAGVLLRVDAAAPQITVHPLRAPLTLELVTGAEADSDIARAKAACAEAGLLPARVVALPRAYLASHQPDGPWPDGPRPFDLVGLARAAFPEAEIGGGVLTNFTELNRCRPDPGPIDFVTFGTTAVVHAADDRSALETLEALGDVFASARALSADQPLRLGLMSIGMRSNPYGASVAANPDCARLPMAMDDPRQRELFAAAFAVAVAAVAARAGVASLAPAMAAGPLGLGTDGALWPIFHAVAALAALSDVEVEVTGGPSTGLVALSGRGKRGVRGVVVNLGPEAADVAAPEGSRVLTLDAAAACEPDWLDRSGESGPARLERFGIIVLKSASA